MKFALVPHRALCDHNAGNYNSPILAHASGDCDCPRSRRPLSRSNAQRNVPSSNGIGEGGFPSFLRRGSLLTTGILSAGTGDTRCKSAGRCQALLLAALILLAVAPRLGALLLPTIIPAPPSLRHGTLLLASICPIPTLPRHGMLLPVVFMEFGALIAALLFAV